MMASSRFDLPAPFWPITTVVSFAESKRTSTCLQVLESVDINERDASARL